MIADPLQTLLAYLASRTETATVTSGRIAAKHKFALPGPQNLTTPDSWPFPSRAIRVQTAGGTPDIHTRRWRIEAQAACFGPSQHDAMVVALAVLDIARTTPRTRVSLGATAALLYELLVVDSPTLGWEPLGEQIGIDTVTFTLRATIAESFIA